MSRERATGREARVVAEEKEPTPGEIGALQGADPDRLLDGEDPETLQVHDVDHWIRVYQDLFAFKRQLLTTAHEIIPDLADAARQEVGKTDLLAMDSEARKFQRRLDFWRQRRKQLEGSE